MNVETRWSTVSDDETSLFTSRFSASKNAFDTWSDSCDRCVELECFFSNDNVLFRVSKVSTHKDRAMSDDWVTYPRARLYHTILSRLFWKGKWTGPIKLLEIVFFEVCSPDIRRVWWNHVHATCRNMSPCQSDFPPATNQVSQRD